MEQVEVEILGLTITARYGTLNSGDILKTDAAYAKHLVDDAMAAKYVKPKTEAFPAAPAPMAPVAPVAKPPVGVVTNPVAAPKAAPVVEPAKK